MTEIRDRTFSNNESVEADGVKFVDCTFESASLVYRGGDHPSFDRCTIIDLGWNFQGPALKTVQLLQLVNNQNPGGQFLSEVFKPGIVFGD